MGTGEAADYQRGACLVVLAAPARTGLHRAQRQRAVDLGERPGLVLAVVPAGARECGQAGAQVVIHAAGEAPFEAAVGARGADVGAARDRFVVAAHVREIEKCQHAGGAAGKACFEFRR